MSLFRPERVFASIDCAGVALVKSRGDAAAPAQAQLIPGAFDAQLAAESLASTARVLAQPQWKSTTRQVVLSDSFVRYLVVERPLGVRSATELELAVNARFEQAYDLSAAQWTIAIDAAPFDRRCIACAIPTSLLAAISNVFSQHGRCASIQPFLICELNRRARQMPRSGWYAAASADNLCLVALANGAIERIRALPCRAPTAAEIGRLVARERLLAGDDGFDHEYFFSGSLSGADAGTPLRRIDRAQWGPQPRSAQYRTALAEVWP